MLKITVLTQAAAGAVEGNSHASTCSRLRCHIFAVGPHPGVWLSTHGEVAVHCEGHYLKGPVMEHGCHRQTASSDQVPSNVKGSHIQSYRKNTVQSQSCVPSGTCAFPASQELRNGGLGLRMKSDICLRPRRLRHMRDCTCYLKRSCGLNKSIRL